ncbi:MAG: hypothetical protein AAB215_01115, partial [Planctomycetota bacterium]
VFTTGDGPPAAARVDEAPGAPNACVLSVEGTPAGAFVRVANFSGDAWRGKASARRGASEATASLDIRAGEIAAASLSLPAGPGGIVAEIRSDPPDGFPEDDRLAIGGDGSSAAVVLHGNVPPDLRAALEAIPEARKPLQVSAGPAPAGSGAISVWASADPPANPTGPFFWVHPREGGLGVKRKAPDAPAGRITRQDTEEPALRGIDLSGADAGLVAPLALPASFHPIAWANDSPVLSFTPGPPAGYLVACDLERSPWTDQATFPVFVRQALQSLLARAPDRATLAREPAAFDLRAPLALYREAGTRASPTPAGSSLACPLFALSLAAFAFAWALEARGR